MRNTRESWHGKWISTDFATVSQEPEFTLEEMFSGKIKLQEPIEERLNPSIYFKKIFEVSKLVRKARLIITCQGIYQAYLNGKKVTDAIFTPDYTDYNDFLMYQTYDVTDLLVEGMNTLAIEVADGWFAGRISVQGGSIQFGNQLALLADLEIDLVDGEKEVIGTDESFTSGTGKHCYADIQIGEKQDFRLDSNWKTSYENLSGKVFEIEADYARLAPQEGPQVYRKQFLAPKKIWHESEDIIVDFGQVIAGRVRLELALEKDQEVILEHAEVLNEEGKFFKNIIGRNKDATDIFVGNGKKEIMEPDFTFHGFRYVKITGLKEIPTNAIQAVAIYSDLPETGYFLTNDSLVNQLLSNILWSQRGNMLSIPTDCPQRERVGWTGDMQVFAPSSTFYMDTNAFIRRWLRSLRINQRSNGEILDYSPAPADAQKSVAFTGSYSSAGWGDAIIMVPWTLYERYGDITVLEENYDAMLKWFDFERKSAARGKKGEACYIWDTKFHYGDWMFPSFMMDNPNPMKTAEVTKDIVATMFLAHSAELLANISEIIGKDGKPFKEYCQKVKTAFSHYFITTKNQLCSDFQGCYVLALAFHMIPEHIKSDFVTRLVEKIHENDDRLDTGFLSIPYLLDVLCENGYQELAKTIFFQDACPSWFYEVKQGATTIWESWAGIHPDGKVGAFSFNHYAFGCVLDWMIRETVGLHIRKSGYRAITIKPSVEIVENFNFNFKSPQGSISIIKVGKDWKITVPKAIDMIVDLSEVGGRVSD